VEKRKNVYLSNDIELSLLGEGLKVNIVHEDDRLKNHVVTIHRTKVKL